MHEKLPSIHPAVEQVVQKALAKEAQQRFVNMEAFANALEEGATAEDFIGVLRAVAPQVGGPRVVAAAPEIMVAMGLALEEEEGQ